MRIAIIGSGKIGATVGRQWADAGHTIRFGSREPARLAEPAAAIGATAGTQEDAVAWAEVVFTAAPYGAWPEFSARLGAAMAGKLVMDAANPYPRRDGAFAQAAIDAKQGSGVPVAKLLPGTFYARAFNSIFWETLRDQAHRPPPRLAVPLVADDPDALDRAGALVADAGFDPVLVGPLVHACTFDVGAPAYNNPKTRDELERLLALIPPG